MGRPPWIIIETKPLSEETVERRLYAAGYRVYLPRYRRLLSPHGIRRAPITTMRPLFECLVFAHDWRGWPTVSINGAIGVMQFGPMRAQLSHEDITIIMRREQAGEFDEVSHAKGIRSDIRLGDEIEVEMFGARVQGVLDELSPDGKAVISACLFGRMVKTRVDAHAIAPAGEKGMT